MAIYMIVFLGLALMSFEELFGTNKKKVFKVFALSMILVLLVLTTIRGGTRGDYKTYKEVYTYMTDTSSLFKEGNFFYEPLYSLLQWVSKKIIDNFQFFLFVIGLIVVYLEHKYAKNFKISNQEDKERIVNVKKGKYYFTIFFILWGLYLANIFVIRSTISLIICFYSVYYIRNRNMRKFLFCVMLATGFHYSALVFLPAYFVFWFRSSLFVKMNLFFVTLLLLTISIRPVALIVAQLLGGTIGIKINTYMGTTDFMTGTGMSESNMPILLLKALSNIGVLLIVGIYFWKFNKNDIYYEGCFNLYLVGCTLYVATLTVGYAFARLSIYYNIFQVPILIYAIRGNGKTNGNRIAYWLFLVLYIATRFVVNGAFSSFITYWQ